MAQQTYRDLVVWQQSIELIAMLYQETKAFPSDETFGLTSQMRRSAVSIAANIAEGYGRLSGGDYLRFLSIARGSLLETETHLYIALRLQYLDESTFDRCWQQTQQVSRLLNGLIRSVRERNAELREDQAIYDTYEDGSDDRNAFLL